MGNKEKNKYEEKFRQQCGNGQIFRANGKNCLMEVVTPDYEAGFTKVTMNFVAYTMQEDGKGKATGSIQIYFSVAEFLSFCRRIARGDIQRIVMEDRARCLRGEARYYGEPQGGKIQYSGMKLSPDLKRDANGLFSVAMLRGSNDISRQFYMAASDTNRADNDITLIAAEGPGKTIGNGIVSPSGKPTLTIKVPMPFSKLEEMAEMGLMRLYALDAQNAMNGTYKRVAYEKTDIIDDVPAEVEEAPAEVVQPVQTVQPVAQTVQPTIQPAQTAQPEQSAPVTITVKFTSPFQAVQDWWVVQAEMGGQFGNIYFKHVPDACKKAQEIGTEVTFNVVLVNGQMVFDSLL